MSQGHWIEITADDGHRMPVWEAMPKGEPLGAVIVVQEIFGVNSHIRSVAQRFAEAGYQALAPALFQRVQADYETGYEAADISAGIAIAGKTTVDDVMRDLRACVGHARAPVAVSGYCWGGTMSWVAAARVDGLAAAIIHYPGHVSSFIDEQPRCPVLAHFAERDQHPTPAQARAVLAAHPDVEGHFYQAGHGFGCDQRPSYDAPATTQAWARTLAFLAQHLAG